VNDERRKTIREAAELLGRAKTLLEIARDEERSAFDNLPEPIQAADNGTVIEEAAEQLEQLVDELETIESTLEELAP
jgi:hypothetical protein